jgi:hypothetical protein
MPKRRPLVGDLAEPDVQAFIRGGTPQYRQSDMSTRQHVKMTAGQHAEPMVSVSVKVPRSVADALRKAMLTRKLEGHTLAQKQDIVSEALREWLTRHKFLL